MKAERRSTPGTERAVEGAEGVEIFEQWPSVGIDLQESEEAQGIEVFASPDAVIPPNALREGEPGGEGLSGDEAEVEPVDDTDYDRVPAARYPEF